MAAQVLTLANVHANGHYLVVDDGGGILVAGVIEKLGGQGRLLAINNSESPPTYHILSQMNYPATYIDDVYCTINWAYIDESWTPGTNVLLLLMCHSNPQKFSADFPPDIEYEGPKSEKQRMRMEKRKLGQEKLNDVRDELFRGEWDG